jgi:hypothetical protein
MVPFFAASGCGRSAAAWSETDRPYVSTSHDADISDPAAPRSAIATTAPDRDFTAATDMPPFIAGVPVVES